MPNEEKAPPTRPPRQTFGSQCFSVFELYVRCEFQKKKLKTFLVAYSKEPDELQWIEEARTEIIDNARYPNYRQWNYRVPGYESSESLRFDVSLESLKQIRVEAYKVKAEEALIDLKSQGYLGCAEAELSQLFLLQSVGDGNVTLKLQNPLKPENDVGNIVFLCREEFHSKQMANLTIKGRKIRKGNCWKWAADPYFLLHRTKESTETAHVNTGRKARVTTLSSLDRPPPERETVIRSEAGKRTSAPKWDVMILPVPVLCRARKGLLIEIEVKDWMRVEADRLVGRGSFTYGDMEEAFRHSKPITLELGMYSRGCISCCKRQEEKELQDKMEQRIADQLGSHAAKVGKKPCHGYQAVNGKKAGSLSIDVQIGRYYSFYDYVRGGLELRLVVGIDLTRSNEGPASVSSLHRWGGAGPNDYEVALRAVGEVVQKYDLEKKHVVYGFGAKLPPTYPSMISNCFALTGDYFSPHVDGVDGLVDAYQRALRVVFLHGPSRMKDVIQAAIDWAYGYKDVHEVRDNGVDMRYWVSLILTDGDIVDKQECKKLMEEASNLPISFLIVGIGDADFTWFEDLNADIQSSQRAANKKTRDTVIERKVVHFTRFNEFRKRPLQDFVQRLMSDLPGVVITYYQSLGIKPWNLKKYEMQSGQLHPVPLVDHTAQDAIAAAKKKNGHTRQLKTGATNCRDLMRMLQSSQRASTLPSFLTECREKLIDSALDYGYNRATIERVLQDGIPDGRIEVLLDTVLHGGYGKRPTYWALAQEVDFAKIAQAKARKSQLMQAALTDLKPPPGAPALLAPDGRGTTHSKMLGDANENFNNDPRKSLTNLRDSASPSSSHSGLDMIDLPGAVESKIVEVCKICRARSIDTEFNPCGHRVACRECAEKLLEQNGAECPYCRKTVEDVLHFVDDQLN